jgi:TonB family protein
LFADGAKASATATLRGVEPEMTCAQPYRWAATIAKAEADYPEIALMQGATGTAIVLVALDAQGSIVAIRLYGSSGSTALDDATKRAAAKTTYTAEVFRCEAVAGDYLFVVDFTR